MTYRIDTIDERGHYYPWVYRAARESDERAFTHGESSAEGFMNHYKAKLVYYGSAVAALEFENEADAVMFTLRFL